MIAVIIVITPINGNRNALTTPASTPATAVACRTQHTTRRAVLPPGYSRTATRFTASLIRRSLARQPSEPGCAIRPSPPQVRPSHPIPPLSSLFGCAWPRLISLWFRSGTRYHPAGGDGKFHLREPAPGCVPFDLSLSQLQAMTGEEAGSSQGAVPSVEEVVGMARRLLRM